MALHIRADSRSKGFGLIFAGTESRDSCCAGFKRRLTHEGTDDVGRNDVHAYCSTDSCRAAHSKAAGLCECLAGLQGIYKEVDVYGLVFRFFLVVIFTVGAVIFTVFFFFLFFLYNGHSNRVAAGSEDRDAFADTGFHSTVKNIDGNRGIQCNIFGIISCAALSAGSVFTAAGTVSCERIGAGDTGGLHFTVYISHNGSRFTLYCALSFNNRCGIDFAVSECKCCTDTHRFACAILCLSIVCSSSWCRSIRIRSEFHLNDNEWILLSGGRFVADIPRDDKAKSVLGIESQLHGFCLAILVYIG